MELRDIKKIVEMMKANELSEFELEDQGFRLSIKRGTISLSQPAAPPVPVAPGATNPPPNTDVQAIGSAAMEESKKEETALVEITAPIVGTFYRAPAPDAEPFVSVGQEVDEDTVLCIIEAMKVMNEIKAEMRGVVRKILVENATPVEYGQALFKIEPL